MSSERNLWLSVILQAVIDASGNGAVYGGTRDSLSIKATKWTLSEDFKTVCSWAEVDPGQVERRIRSARERIRKKMDIVSNEDNHGMIATVFCAKKINYIQLTTNTHGHSVILSFRQLQILMRAFLDYQITRGDE